jgi:hypothetical protein
MVRGLGSLFSRQLCALATVNRDGRREFDKGLLAAGLRLDEVIKTTVGRIGSSGLKFRCLALGNINRSRPPMLR